MLIELAQQGGNQACGGSPIGATIVIRVPSAGCCLPTRYESSRVGHLGLFYRPSVESHV